MRRVIDKLGTMPDLEHHVIEARDGLRCHIRPLRPEDAVHLVDLFQHMGPDSRFFRFNVSLADPNPDLVWREARRLATIDPERDGAWLLFADLPDQTWAPIGGARFIRLDDDLAEASLAVRDDQQNKGIGRQLLSFLIAQARKAGVQRLTATVQRANRPLWRMLSHSELVFETSSEGAYTTIEADLSRGKR